MIQQERIKEVCKRQDFTCTISKEGRGYFFTFETWTNFGQDWLFECSASNIEELLNNMYDYLDNYDEDYEASLWVGADGHGKNGAPYHIVDIVADMMDGLHRLDNLYKELSKI
ncbi:MAG: hypothetical protein IJ759_05950 [Bacteroidales bacterium]|nr:hypothetical protein [Bacteroidales bacterium]